MAAQILLRDSEKANQPANKLRSRQELTDDDRQSFRTTLNVRLIYWEIVYYQWQGGLLPDDLWDVQVDGMRSVMQTEYA